MQNYIGLILPGVIDLINKRVADSRLRFWISLAVCVVVGTAVNFQEISEPGMLLGDISIVFATSQIVYNTYWKKSDLRARLINR